MYVHVKCEANFLYITSTHKAYDKMLISTSSWLITQIYNAVFMFLDTNFPVFHFPEYDLRVLVYVHSF